ncbi:MAG TPA: ABC transporter permease [Candidatus Peribacteria bacterium]|nr:ABC transporter permease [Candidatus Peribacteria bacterium]
MPSSVRRFGWKQMLRVVFAMGWSDFTLKYRGSMLGYLWSLLFPLTKFVVILHVFRPFVSDSIPLYPLYLFLGIVLWEHFALTTVACMSVLVEKAQLVQKVSFPRIVLMFSVGWLHVIILSTYLLIFFAIGAWAGVPLQIGALYVVVTIVQATLLGLGIGMILSSISLKYRDVPHLWAVALQVLFWLTPIAYPHDISGPVGSAMASFARTFQPSLWSLMDAFIRFQPLSLLLYDVRRATLYVGSLGMPSLEHTAVTTAICAAFFIAGTAVFIRRSRYFLQEY